MSDKSETATYRKQQISQWDLAPDGAFVVYRHVNTGLSEAICSWIFRDQEGRIVPESGDPALKIHLTELAGRP